MINKVVLGLGSNRSLEINNEKLSPLIILQQACEQIKKLMINNSCVFSSVYQSKAMYYEDQEDFYNMVVIGDYEKTPEELLTEINKIEYILGRNRDKEIRNGPRTLDIDIELFGNQIINTENLQIPHKKIQERQFVLLPLLEIFPKVAEPISGIFYSEYLKKLPNQGVKYFSSLSD